MKNTLKNKLTFEETVRMAINSVGEGLMNRQEAIRMIEDAAGQIVGSLESSLLAAVMTLERAVEEYREAYIRHPLDDMTLVDAQSVYETKGMLLYCRDGHAVTMFREAPVEHNEPVAVCP